MSKEDLTAATNTLANIVRRMQRGETQSILRELQALEKRLRELVNQQ